MKMGVSDFTMNVQRTPRTEEAASLASADVARLVLTALTSLQGPTEELAAAREPSGSNVRNLWDWMYTWKRGDNKGLAINMYMYNNTIAMNKTTFKLNVGRDRR